MSAALTFQAGAGTLFYVPIPAVGSDAQSGLDASKGYTNAVAAGTAKERSVNGVPFAPLSGAENVATVNGVTLSAATGTLANGGGKADSIRADGAMARLFSGMIFNDGAADNSEQYVVVDPATLTAGKTYDLRVYVANATGENRQVNLAFAGDGKPVVNTDFFNEDDATTSAGGFADPNQVYYINYRFTWDGVSTPGFTATQRFGNTPFVLFALTNQEVGGDVDARPAGALVAAPLAPIAARPTTTSRRTRVVVEDEDIGVSSDVFYRSETLRSRGRWVTVGRYGRCWQPLHVDDDWQPYTRGRWVHSSDEGWVWDSDEDFGWATYHYGRWFREEDSGWYWVPGRVWAPAWVSWRHGHSYVGWAPLPPVAIAVVGIGIGSWADERWSIGPQAYNFVNTRDFGAPSISNVIISRQENVNIMTNTTNVTNIVNSNNTTIYNGGPNFQALSNTLARNGGQPIPTVQVARQAEAAPVTPDGKFSQLSGGVLALTAPPVPRNKKSASLPPVAATIAAPKLDKGWKGVTDPTRTAALQAKIASETPGAKSKTAPAMLPGTIPTATAATGAAATNGLKPFRNGKPGGSSLVQPGQPGKPVIPGSVNPLRPGAPVNPTAVTPTLPGQPVIPPSGKGKRGENPAVPNIPVVKPGAPVNPTAVTPTLPGQPVIPPSGKGKRGENPAVPNVPVVKPGAPVNPTAVTPTLPGQPVITPNGKGKRGEKSAVPNVPFVKPGQPVNPAVVTPAPGQTPKTPEVPSVKPGKLVKPGSVTPPVTVPPAVQPTIPTTPKPETGRSKNRIRKPEPAVPPTVVNPAAPAVPTPAPAPVIKPTVAPKESPRNKKNTPPTAPANPAPVVKPVAPVPAPVIKPAPAPEPVRIQKRNPQPAAPEPAQIKKQTPPPAAPVPAPAPKQIQRPAPQAVAPPRPAPVVQPRPAPQPVAPPRPAPVVQPRPAPQPVAPPRPAPVVIQPRPAPPVAIPARPAAPAPAPAPGKGPQPTPTPAPGSKR